jgi:hypothetical protein
MQAEAIPLASDIVKLQGLIRGELVAVYRHNVKPDRSKYPVSSPFWYYRGEVKHHHRDGTLTVRFRDCRGWKPVILRFDTTFHAKQYLLGICECYALLPWIAAIGQKIQVQRLNHLCGSTGNTGWAHLGEQELDEALALVSRAFARYLDAGRERCEVIVGTLDAVLNGSARAILSVGDWRYEVTITNKESGRGNLRIYSTQGSLHQGFFAPLVAERLFSSLDEAQSLLAEGGGIFPAVPKDSTWCSTRYLEQSRQVE